MAIVCAPTRNMSFILNTNRCTAASAASSNQGQPCHSAAPKYSTATTPSTRLAITGSPQVRPTDTMLRTMAALRNGPPRNRLRRPST